MDVSGIPNDLITPLYGGPNMFQDAPHFQTEVSCTNHKAPEFSFQALF
jgi:hypothetical protein